jgi:hypothetical protein
MTIRDQHLAIVDTNDIGSNPISNPHFQEMNDVRINRRTPIRGRVKTRELLWLAAALLFAGEATAAIKNVRVVWDGNPSTEAVVGFSRSGSSSSGQYVKYGTSTSESTWTTKSTVTSQTFKSSVVSYFVRLTGLTANTEYFFKACDSSGCSAAHLFRTAPSSEQAMTFVTGGDSRTNRTNRQEGNRLVKKIRPHFVMFSGDYTDSHSASEMDTWLADWLLSYADSTVNGIAFKQVHPLVPTVGNHESSDLLFMCRVFGVDFDRNGSCSLRDTYGAFNIGSALRVYTLNTEFGSSYTNERAAQLSWLNNDLANNYSDTRWRIAQYHKPMLPRSSSKPSVNTIATDWAQPFYDYRMNLGIESDTHLAKYTWPVAPNGSSDYARVSAGTVYIGEGAWGAPLRTADRPATWLADLSSFMHINIVQVSGTKMDVRAVRLTGESATATLSKSARDADPLALPTGMSLWNAANVGTVYALELSSTNHTQVVGGGGGGGGGGSTSTTLSATQDVTVGNGGYYSNGNTVLADGSDSGQVLRGMFKWNVSGIASTKTVSGAAMKMNVINASGGVYNLYALNGNWAESGATYAQAQATGSLIGSGTPSAKGTATITLNNTGIALVQGWVKGTATNNGVVLVSGGTTDGVDVTSREGGNAAKLVVTHD